MVARQDDEGFIWLMDRKKEVIITGGEIIYPLEIGELLMNHLKIRDPLRSDRLSAICHFR
jgi:acyl-CoA synthetase (AMP-forming)/AMP-acid ligase II